MANTYHLVGNSAWVSAFLVEDTKGEMMYNYLSGVVLNYVNNCLSKEEYSHPFFSPSQYMIRTLGSERNFEMV